ncbi:MAG TPA: MgtC/SapB family protein [Bacillales bacterium]|nr:MgtC/SapB family protein [Bacillales bacterium]
MHWLPDDALVITVRLLIAAVLSGLIGLEREAKRHPAGFRTHLLVGIGACLMMLLSIYGFNQFLEEHANARLDPARLPAYVVSGIGFLGAGTILVHGVTVKGLTTAASIWAVAGIGLVVGNGMYYAAGLTTAVVILSLLFLNKVENSFINAPRTEQLNIVVENKAVSLSKVVELVEAQQISVEKVIVEDYPSAEEKDLIKYALLVRFPEGGISPSIYDRLYKTDHVYKVYTAD